MKSEARGGTVCTRARELSCLTETFNRPYCHQNVPKAFSDAV
jgi:hypothetical protein